MFHCITICANEFFTLKRELEFLPTTFAVILTPVALPIVPKVEFNFELIMYITILFLNSKKLLSAIVVKTYLKALRSSCFRVFATIVGRKTSSPERFVITFLHLLIYKCFLYVQTTLLVFPSTVDSPIATKPVICSSLMIHDRETLARLTSKPPLFDDLNIPAGWRACL